jgi:hypothetical protein
MDRLGVRPQAHSKTTPTNSALRMLMHREIAREAFFESMGIRGGWRVAIVWKNADFRQLSFL